MGRRGNCWTSEHCSDAIAERFFSNLKVGRVWQRQCANHTAARNDIVDYIVSFYNFERQTQYWGICYLPSTSGKWQQKALSSCPKLVDHSKGLKFIVQSIPRNDLTFSRSSCDWLTPLSEMPRKVRQIAEMPHVAAVVLFLRRLALRAHSMAEVVVMFLTLPGP